MFPYTHTHTHTYIYICTPIPCWINVNIDLFFLELLLLLSEESNRMICSFFFFDKKYNWLLWNCILSHLSIVTYELHFFDKYLWIAYLSQNVTFIGGVMVMVSVLAYWELELRSSIFLLLPLSWCSLLHFCNISNQGFQSTREWDPQVHT